MLILFSLHLFLHKEEEYLEQQNKLFYSVFTKFCSKFNE